MFKISPRTPQIISVSRRTDIPAFYGQWFINRIRQGWGIRYNPYNGRVAEVSLRPEDVAAIIFWSKNYAPIVTHLDELDKRGYNLVFHFTITGLPDYFEKNVPPAEQTIKIFKLLAKRYSPGQMLWRYDPVILTQKTDYNFHLENFNLLCSKLEGFTISCFTSFLNLYGKVNKRLADNKIFINGDSYQKKMELAGALADIAHKYGIELYSCCNDYLLNGDIKKAHCIDAKLLQQIFGVDASAYPYGPSRKECGCYKSVDLGMYDTCMHQCLYCYANNREKRIEKNYERHDSLYPAQHTGVDLARLDRKIKKSREYIQTSLKY